jgi:hypothetical protein
MSSRARRRNIQWRRVAQFEPIRVEGTPSTRDDVAERPSGPAAIKTGTRVILARDPENESCPEAVAVESLDEQRLGYLPPQVAAWVAPLMDSGRVTFDGRIYALDTAAQSTDGATAFYLSLTQFELCPVEQSSLALALRVVLRAPVLAANWSFAHAAAIYHAISHSHLPPTDRYAADDHSRS